MCDVRCCRFVVGDKEYPAGYGNTKKEAKEEAAKLVYHEICGSKTTEVSYKHTALETFKWKASRNFC